MEEINPFRGKAATQKLSSVPRNERAAPLPGLAGRDTPGATGNVLPQLLGD